MKRVFRGVLFCPLNRGKSGEAGKGEASVASQSVECSSCHITQKGESVTLTLYSSPVRAIPQPSAPQALSPLEQKRTQPFYTTRGVSRAPFYNLRRSRHHNPRPERPSNLRTLRTLGAKPRQPSPLNPLNPHAAGVSKGRVPKKFQKPC